MLADRRSFVLLDDAREGAVARLYRDCVRTVVAATPDAVTPAFEAIREAVATGLQAAGFLAYEAGEMLVAGAPAMAAAQPLLWFGLFERHELLSQAEVAELLPDPAGAWVGAPQPDIARDTYDDALARVLDLIRAGDIYQANLTFAASVRFAGDPLAAYARLRREARAGYGAVVDTGEITLLSLSPELFFTLDGDALTCRPMKGTAPRGVTPAEDRTLAATLAGDAKQRAENLMIVDLMRNDVSRVAAAGSVAVPKLFTVETYPTIHQMTSTVTATLAEGHDAVDVIGALFPCGSITGAPKRRAMEVIAEVEARARGPYTGSIGRIDPSGAAFNVAIRTLAIHRDGYATLGLGSGIVADSRADDEWAECLAKAAFVTAGQRGFDLIETMAFDPEAGLLRLERHLARLQASADLFGYPFDRHAARNDLQAATFRLRAPRRLRLLLAPSGAVAIEVGAMPPVFDDAVSVAVVPLPVASADFRLRHKTTDRAFYDDARRLAGTTEVVFESAGVLTEGSFTSLFVARDDGVLVTPPLARGLLPGILREALIAEGRAIEGDVTRADLAHGFFVGNAVRGLIPAHVADANAATL
ncbi:aminodeoxychorismate synthase component I [Sphingomonas oligophenolica]|uniref:Probable branched-chain-amino-acid aminotransferase n=1 Tax=Sphingomonas oligophenolica TaxID=301154 RepID=A0A502CK20_9SPHN|nr:aminodeoxychorismate synthase component I [Sphingomonas oligophenolica]TPG13567.1 aminodeoxychorismate synthase component I [Sphingomonas oligophenolica]